MQSTHSGVGDQAFGEDADTLITVRYRSLQDALEFFQSALRDHKSLGLLQGPKSSGKTTVVRQLVPQLPRDTAIALIDGTHKKPHELLSEMLSQFGYETELRESDELLKMINVFGIQQIRSNQAPVLIIDNVDRMYPSALGTLNTLAALTAQRRFVFRIILTGHEGLSALVASDGMTSIAERSTGVFSMGPLTAKETMIYLHARLQASGVQRGDTVFPVDVCDQLHEQSGGWPGMLNEAARKMLGPQPPRIIVTRDGSPLSEYTFGERKVIIGRSDFADIVIDDDFVSKMHAVMLLYRDALLLLDLNSANGTTVNSVKVKKTILRDNDVISLGHHRLEVRNAPAISSAMEKIIETKDTAKMKSLGEMRRLKTQGHAMTTTQGKKQG